jgi:hypothetical protein
MTPYDWIAVALLIVSVVVVVHACRMNGKWLGGVMLFMTFSVLLAVAGCASIDKSSAPPADWPELRIVIHRHMNEQRCSGLIMGCTVPDFCERRCNVYLTSSSPWVEAHERSHCAGYDHPGDDTMKALWTSYKRMDGPRFCSLRMGIATYCRLWPEDREQCSDGLTLGSR